MAEAKLTDYIEELHGNLGAFNIRTTKNGIVFAKKKKRSTAEATAEQVAVQNLFTAASKNWQNLTNTQREEWEQYAAAYFPRDKDRNGAGPSGQALYSKAAWYLQAAGLALPTAAPVDAPPARPTGITISAAADETEVQIGVDHSIADVTGHRLRVEVTPRLGTAAQKPLDGAFRAIAGVGVASNPALQASGLIYTFNPIRYNLLHGDRFGIRATLIAPSGIPSRVLSATVVQDVT